MQKWIYDLSVQELKEEIIALSMKPYLAGQVFSWLYKKGQPDIGRWSNISKANQEILAKVFDTQVTPVVKIVADQAGTKKFLIGLHDNNRIEAVSITEKDHYTFCLSTQAGCALGCRFCATGAVGFKRQLSSGEILCQALALKNDIPGYKGKINVVFMGMGEPLLNYDNLKRALLIMTTEKGLGISPRRITVSTAGILKGIRAIEQDFPNLKLSLSLNAADFKTRQEIMPISATEKPADILAYFRGSRRKYRITFEYVLLGDVNDSLDQAQRLAKLLKGLPCKINLIPFNEHPSLPYHTPAVETVEAFAGFLRSQDYTVIVRWSKGKEIASACGQLTAG